MNGPLVTDYSVLGGLARMQFIAGLLGFPNFKSFQRLILSAWPHQRASFFLLPTVLAIKTNL